MASELNQWYKDYLTNDNYKQIKKEVRELPKDDKAKVWDAYAHYKKFFKGKYPTEQNLILACSVSYSWMPTMLDIYADWGARSIKKASGALEVLKEINSVNPPQTVGEGKKKLEILQRLINNSIVGASKVIHLFNDNAPIIDSRVIKSWNYFFPKKELKIKSDVSGYLRYWEMILIWQEAINKARKKKVSVRNIEKLFFDLAKHTSITPPRKNKRHLR